MPLHHWLIDSANVYTEHATTGRYTVPARMNLACRLAKISAENAGTARAELLSTRRLIWQSYEMPANAQVEVGGARWNIEAGTIGTYRNKRGAEVYRAADVVRAEGSD